MNRNLKIRKKLNILCAALIFLYALCIFPHTALARSMPDLSASGSITLELSCDGQPAAGGQIAVYMVGNIVQNSGNLSFSLSDDFYGCGLSLDIDYGSASEIKTLAGALAAFADENNLSGITAETGSNGKVTVSDLSVGLYLVVQTQAAEGFEAFLPFLVSVPMYDEIQETYVYDVDASPKVTLTVAQEETTTGEKQTTPSSDNDEGEGATSGGDGGEESTSSSGDSEEESTSSGGSTKEDGTASGDNSGEEGTSSGGDSEEENTSSDGSTKEDGTASGDNSEEKNTSSGGNGGEESTSSGGDDGEGNTFSDGDSEEESTTSVSYSEEDSTASGTGESTAEETTASEDTGSNVQTNDDSRLMMWFVIFWASALILVILVIRKYQARKK